MFISIDFWSTFRCLVNYIEIEIKKVQKSVQHKADIGAEDFIEWNTKQPAVTSSTTTMVFVETFIYVISNDSFVKIELGFKFFLQVALRWFSNFVHWHKFHRAL